MCPAAAGPPYQTDDPEPTDYRNWEIYTGVDYQYRSGDGATASLPFAEFNYGALPNVQVSASLPIQFDSSGAARAFGYGATDFGIKLRFVQESNTRPQISFYPSVEIPAAGGSLQTLLPLWIQKSEGPWTAFGGGGITVNAGAGRHDSSFVGAALERQLSPGTAIGAEFYHDSSDAPAAAGTTDFNVGAIASLGELHALLFSIGRSLGGAHAFQFYSSYEFKLGPKEPAAR